MEALRPRYLELEGLQSFKEMQAIDFDRLGEMGLFGIFGPTGSGKSTILDAVTLALYGNVQRAQNRTQGIMNTEVDIMRVLFVFDLVKDNERKNYKVERVYRRKKDSELSIEAKITRLFETTAAGDIVLADKQGEVNSAVIELIGLEFDDFTRSVVLPQNKFQEFLLSPKAEKTKMLERIFCLEEYGRQLTERVNRKLSVVRHRLSTIEGAMAVLGDASQERLSEAEQNLKAAAEDKERLDKELKLLESRFDSLKADWELTLELAEIRSALEAHEMKGAGFAEKKRLFERAIRAESVADNIKAFQDAQKNLQNSEEMLTEVNKGIPDLEKELSRAEALHEAAGKRSKLEIPGLVERKTRLNDAIAVVKDIESLEIQLRKLRNDYTNTRNEIDKVDKDIEKNKTTMEELADRLSKSRGLSDSTKVSSAYRKEVQEGLRLEEDYKRARKNSEESIVQLKALHESFERLQNAVRQLEAKSEVLDKELKDTRLAQQEHLKNAPADRSGIMELQGNYERLKLISGSLRARKSELDDIDAKLRVTGDQLREVKKEHEAAEAVKAGLEKKLEDQKNHIEHQRAMLDKQSAFKLARLLNEGEPCPVCGSTEHPRPVLQNNESNYEELEKEVELLEQEREKTGLELRSMENSCIKLGERHIYLAEQRKRLNGEYAAKVEEYRNLKNQLPGEFGSIDTGDPEKMEDKLKELLQLEQQLQISLESWEKQNEQLLEKISSLEEQSTRHKIETSRKTAELEHAAAERAKSAKASEQAEAELANKEGTYGETLKKLKVEDISKENERLLNADKENEKLQKELLELQKAMDEARAQKDGLMDMKHKLVNSFADIRAEGERLKTEKQAKESLLQKVSPDGSPEKEIAAIYMSIKGLEDEEKKASERRKEAENRYNTALSHRNTLIKQCEIYSTAYENEKTRLEILLQEKGFSSIEEAGQSVMGKAEQSELEQEIKAYEDEGNKLNARKAITDKKLGGRLVTEEEWNETSGAYNKMKQDKEESISRFESAKNSYDTLKKNYEGWVVYNKQRELFSRKKDMLEQIKRLLQGNSFIEYISEERLRYIAREASETLGILTKFRYSLELDTDSGFVVRDNANGGVHRMVSTLSGGETFLTSLSLALALSSHIQLKGQSPLEFFFLDEGFGTLDNNLLDTVMDSLERLSTTKRVIGLISHVPELKNRMARRLVVDQPVQGGRGSLVRIEKA